MNNYADLVSLYEEFREFIKPTVRDGVPDFTAATMSRQYGDLKELQGRLQAIDITRWPVEQQVDYHVVRAEMNGVEFDHRVLRQWARDPGFYNLTDGIYPRLLVHHSRSLSNWGLFEPVVPMSAAGVEDFRMKLQAVPKLFHQAKTNLIEAVGDLARIAIRVKEKDIQMLERFAKQFKHHHPELISDTEAAIAATEDFRDWLSDKLENLPPQAGVGKENYNWWMKNVHLIPYDWEQFHTMVEGEYNRAMCFLKLEEHKNRNVPDSDISATKEVNDRRQRECAQKVFEFVRDEEIITVPEDLEPLPPHLFPRMWGKSAYLREDDRGFFEETNDREPMTNVAHVFFGHYYLGGRKIWYQEHDKRPIRSDIRLYDMHEARSEALAFGIEEWLMQLGLFDDNPRSREITYTWLAFRAIRALSDLRMHSNEYSLDDALENLANGVPNGWAEVDSDAVWWDIEETLRAPGHSANYTVGKNMIQQLMVEQAQQLGDDFSIRRHYDDFMNGGIMPIALSRWELTGYGDQMAQLLE